MLQSLRRGYPTFWLQRQHLLEKVNAFWVELSQQPSIEVYMELFHDVVHCGLLGRSVLDWVLLVNSRVRLQLLQFEEDDACGENVYL